MALTSRQKQAIVTKQKIFEKGEELIATKGFDHITIDDIVEACGLSKGTFYHYFKTKDELFSYVEHKPYMELMEELDKMKDRPLEEKLRYYIKRRTEISSEFGVHFSQQWLRHAADPAYYESYGENTKIDFDLRMIQKYLSESLENGELIPCTPVQTLSQVINFALLGTSVYRSISNDSFKIAKWALTFSDFVVDSLLKPYLK